VKLSGFTYLLGRSLSMLGSIAARVVNSPSAARVVNRVHARWHAEGVTLTATDAHRALTITLAPERTGGREEEAAVFAIQPGYGEGMLLHTIFRAPDGDVKVIGERMEPVGISRTRTEPAQFGINLGHIEGADYPIDAVNEIRASILKRGPGTRALEINTAYVAEGLAMISGLWALVQHPAHPERVTMLLPDHPHAPMMFTSQFPEKQPLFQIEYILMPYRTP